MARHLPPATQRRRRRRVHGWCPRRRSRRWSGDGQRVHHVGIHHVGIDHVEVPPAPAPTARRPPRPRRPPRTRRTTAQTTVPPAVRGPAAGSGSSGSGSSGSGSSGSGSSESSSDDSTDSSSSSSSSAVAARPTAVRRPAAPVGAVIHQLRCHARRRLMPVLRQRFHRQHRHRLVDSGREHPAAPPRAAPPRPAPPRTPPGSPASRAVTGAVGNTVSSPAAGAVDGDEQRRLDGGQRGRRPSPAPSRMRQRR